MTRNVKLGLILGTVVVIFMIITWFIGSALGESPGQDWLFRILLWTMVLVAAGFSFWWFAKSGAEATGGRSAVENQLETTFATARNRLKPTGTTLANVPLVLVLGPEGSTKTTAIVRSGLEPDLLAGEIFRGQDVTPTTDANVWFSRKAVVVEAGGKLLGDDGAWARLVRHILPERLGAVLGGRPQSPRVAAVCFSCEELVKPGAGDAVVKSAAFLREKLSSFSQRLGVRLPVYVLFTKVDRIPHFAEYVRSFSEQEVREVLGSTLRLAPPGGGSYAEREYQRLNDAFDRLVRSLARKRLDLLVRDVDSDVQAGTYEFPRELRKIASVATQFLVELCRPSQLAVSPFLRGFYFSGVRAVMSSDAPLQPTADSGSPQMGATSVFGGQRPAPAAVPAMATPSSRKVPQWLFLNRLFQEVILHDRVALGVPQTGSRLNILRRGLLSVAVALSFLLLLGFLVSFVANWRLEHRVVNASLALTDVVSLEPELPTWETLRELEALRRPLERLGRYERSGVPFRLRWWLYTGDDLYPSARTFYSAKLENLMVGVARGRLLNSLRGLGDDVSETSEYDSAYATLKAYLMTTTHPQQMDSAFLSPILLDRWLNNREIDEERRDLAAQQFAFYSGPLCRNQTCASEADMQVVERTRGFLAQFTGPERIYPVVLADAGRDLPSLQFNRLYPESVGYIAGTYEIPGVFTKDGWVAMQAALENIASFLGAEDWVIGEQRVIEQNPDSLKRHIRTRYISEYVQRWTDYVASSSVVQYRNLNDAVEKLEQLSGNQSLLLKVIQIVSDQTAVDTTFIGPAFQPARAIIPPDTTTLVLDANRQYVDGLVGLHEAMRAVAQASSANRAEEVATAQRQAGDARVAARQIAQNFSIEGQALNVGNRLENLLLQPIAQAEQRLRGLVARAQPGSGVPGRVRAFCQEFGQLWSLFPFNPSASAEASLDDVIDMFQPDEGTLARLIDNDLSDIVERRSGGVVAKPGASLTPTEQFLEFLTRARGVSQALWSRGNDADPTFEFFARFDATAAVPNIELRVDGLSGQYSRTQRAATGFTWNGPRAGVARLIGRLAGRDQPLLSFDGQWALFRLFSQSENWQELRPGRYRVPWQIAVPGGTASIEAQVDFQDAPIVNPEYFRGMVCPSSPFVR